MKTFATVFCVGFLAGVVHAEQDTPHVATAITTPFITGYILSQSRSAELGLLGKPWDGYSGNSLNGAISNLKGQIGESVAESAYSVAFSVDIELKKSTWVSIAPRFGGTRGFDHVYIQVDKNGLPRGMILAESKYGSAQLDDTNDGRQMGHNWRMKRLATIGNRYYMFAKSPEPIIRTKDIPIGAKSLDLYFSKTQKVVIWEEGGKWYTNAERITDEELRIRATTYGKYFTSASSGAITTKNRLFNILEQNNGDYLVDIYNLTDDAQIVLKLRTIVIPQEFVAKGKVDTKILMEKLKKLNPSWSDKKIKQEAEAIKKVVSNKEFLNAATEAHKQAIKEIKHSSIASAGIAGALSLVFQLGSEAWDHGADFKSYDFKGISLSTAKSAAIAGASSWAGQRTALHLAGETIFKKQISSRIAGRIGGSVGASIILAESFGGCITGNKSWKDGSIEAGIGAASMAAGHYAAAGVSAWIASSAASGGAIATGATAAAGTATAVSAGAAGTTVAAGAVGAGTAGSGSFMALAAASGPAIAAIAAGAAISYGGYIVYDHYKSVGLTKGEFSYYEKMVDLLFVDKDRYGNSIDRMLGFHSALVHTKDVGAH